MNQELKITLVLCSTIVLVVAIVAGSVSYYQTRVWTEFMQQGYSEQPVPGSTTRIWVKGSGKDTQLESR
jgi:CHASE3 domain sensor protein